MAFATKNSPERDDAHAHSDPDPHPDDAHQDDAHAHLPDTVTQAVKILVVGAFGVGKTTLIGSVSEIRPLRTEERMTQASVGVDDLRGLGAKSETTVAMDFGRITLSPSLVLYLFGAPGQRRFWELWKGLVTGAIGLLVLVDTRRIEDSFEVLDQWERYSLPYVVAVNRFPDSAQYEDGEIREALDLPASVPVVTCEATDPRASQRALEALVRHAIEQHRHAAREALV
ncbi:GTP-binding protein [Streptomyces daliensis]|uniref:ATP/GTP-binding protein n=1 Tax=Streptomyces daliensis TaxID=299421 RepID=A0A8T4INZ3_9ACTN|nr:ATP/GTP-binding protein [Streptomyces daliensis]